MAKILILFLMIPVFLLMPAAHAQEKAVPDAFHSTALKLPRYASLQADEVYVRSGPGQNYPIKWVYKQKQGLPVEITLEYEVWRKIRDYVGQEGWVHLSLLSGKRTGVIQEAIVPEAEKPPEEVKVPNKHMVVIPPKEAPPAPVETTPPPPEPIPVYQKPRPDARWAAKAMPGAIVTLNECVPGWCLVSAEGYKGWAERKYIWGVYEDEVFK